MFDVHLLDLVPWVGGELGYVRQLIGWAVTRDMRTQRILCARSSAFLWAFWSNLDFCLTPRNVIFMTFSMKIHPEFTTTSTNIFPVHCWGFWPLARAHTPQSLYICHIYLLLYILVHSFPPLGSLGCFGLKIGNGGMIMLMHSNAFKIFLLCRLHACSSSIHFLFPDLRNGNRFGNGIQRKCNQSGDL